MDAQIEAAWAAGFFDGEGCSTTQRIKRYARRRPRTMLKMVVGHSGPEATILLQRFASAVGAGRVGLSNRAKLHPDGTLSQARYIWACASLGGCLVVAL